MNVMAAASVWLTGSDPVDTPASPPSSVNWPEFVTQTVATLAITLLVVVIITPWVEARRRRRERWQDSVWQLSEVLEWEVFVALREARRESVVFKSIVDEHGNTSDERVLELIDKWREQEREQFKTLAAAMQKADRLMRRVCNGPPRSRRLNRIYYDWMMTETYVKAPEFDRYSDSATDESIDEAFKVAESWLSKCRKSIDQMAYQARPPRRGIVESVKSRWRSLRGRDVPLPS